MTVNLPNQEENSQTSTGEIEEIENELSIMDKINDYLLKFSKVPLKEKLFFVQHLSLMLKSGISLSVGIKTLAEQTENPLFKKILTEIGSSVEKGSSFAESLMPHKKTFSEMFINMVEAGEASGKLEDVLNQLFIQMKKEHALISKVKSAMTYPAVIMIAMVGIGGFMLVFIVPKITGIFTEMNAELPLPTKILIGVSDAIVNNGILTVIIVLVLGIIIYYTLKNPKGRYIFQAGMLRAPILGPIIKKINIARFARNISSLLRTDIMIIESFQITARVLGNLHYREALEDMAQRIKKGGKLNETVKAYPKLFNPIVVTMIAIGEETGELDNILAELANFYEEEVDQIMESLPAIIEPLLILVLGLGVGGVAVAIIMPMYALGNAV